MKNAVALCLVLVGCSGGTELRPGEGCGDWAPCATVSGRAFRICALPNASECRLLTNEGSSFTCAACNDCAGAEAQAAAWCGDAPAPDLGSLGDQAFSQPSGDLARPAEQCSSTTPRASAPEVSVLPEAGEAPYLDVLKKAQKDIRVSAYLMGYGGILDTLEAKVAAGVKVRAILDVGQNSTNQKYYDLMKAAGMEVLWSDVQFPYYHAKYMVVDGVDAVLSTGNYSTNFSIEKERNFVVHLADPNDVADLVTLFDADWSRQSVTLSCTRLLVSPTGAKERLLEFIASAQTTLEIESMQFAELDVRAAVAARKLGGVDVRVILAAPSWIDANADAATFLKSRGIPVKWMSTPGVHVKAMVADGARAFIGSQNMSWTSLEKNREVGVVLTDASSLTPVKATFEKDWAAATAF